MIKVSVMEIFKSVKHTRIIPAVYIFRIFFFFLIYKIYSHLCGTILYRYNSGFFFLVLNFLA